MPKLFNDFPEDTTRCKNLHRIKRLKKWINKEKKGKQLWSISEKMKRATHPAVSITIIYFSLWWFNYCSTSIVNKRWSYPWYYTKFFFLLVLVRLSTQSWTCVQFTMKLLGSAGGTHLIGNRSVCLTKDVLLRPTHKPYWLTWAQIVICSKWWLNCSLYCIASAGA